MSDSRQLSIEELQNLFDFVSSKKVKYDDLKYEIVDHIASSIEEIRKADPTATFDSALKETYGRFPITGFAEFVEGKVNSLKKHWDKKFIKFYIDFFKLPKLITSISLIFFIWTLFQYIRQDYVLIGISISIIIMFLYGTISIMLSLKISKRFSFITAYNVQYFSMNLSTVVIISNITHWTIGNNINSQIFIILVSIITGMTLMLNYALLFVFPKILQEEINKKYAHLNIKLAI